MSTEDEKLLAEGLRNAYGVGVSEAASKAHRIFEDAFFEGVKRVTKQKTEQLLRKGNLALSGTGFAVFKTGESWGVQGPSGGKAWGTFKNLRETFGLAEKEPR